MVKPNVRIINCARGGLIDEEELVKAIHEKRVAGAAIDVFEKEPCTESILFGEDNIIVTPHLGASTAEAQVLAARDVAEQIVDVFKGLPARAAINVPYIPSETMTALTPYLKLTSTLCKLAYKLAEGQSKTIRIKYNGDIANYDTNVLKAAVVGGLLDGVSEERVNIVNCNVIAAKRGLTIIEEKETTCANYTSLLTVEIATTTGVWTVAGTIMNNESHIVRINDYWLDIVPAPGSYFLFSDHRDRPGLIGAVGKITGDANVNISSMHLGRLKPRGQALLVLAWTSRCRRKRSSRYWPSRTFIPSSWWRFRSDEKEPFNTHGGPVSINSCIAAPSFSGACSYVTGEAIKRIRSDHVTGRIYR